MTGTLILAAGSSSRLGKPKQNLIFKNQTLLQRAVDTALGAGCGPIIVVLGANSEMVRPTIEDKSVHIIYSQNWNEGMASSIRLGIAELQIIYPKADSVILMLCDQPFVDTATLEQLVQSKSKKGIAACAYSDTIGPPVLFDKFYFDDLLRLEGQEGAKKLLLKYPNDVAVVTFPLGSIDIDTAEDFEKINSL
jgi:molybdenum cofactor cytidylyltransferase